MNYKKSDFAAECLHLPSTPQNSREVYNKLICLCQLEQRFDPNANRFYVRPLSKRRERLVKIFWAFRRMEARK